MLCVGFLLLSLVYPMLRVSLNCLFLIAPSVFSNIYSILHYRTFLYHINKPTIKLWGGCRGHDRMVVGFTTTLCKQCLSLLMSWVWISIRVRCPILCDKVCQWFATGRWVFRIIRFPPPIKLTTTILLKYCWKWRKHHQTNHSF